MRRAFALAIAMAALGSAGCAAQSNAPVGHHPVVLPADVAHAKHIRPAHNRAATAAEAARLLALVKLPPGAKPSPGSHDKELTGPALGTPETRSLVDRHRFWRVSSPMGAVMSYLRSHTPAGLSLSGTGQGTSSGVVTSEGIGWSEPDRSYATGLGLDVGIAPTASGTLIRADGFGEWIDPRPIRDTSSGRRLRVTVAGGCPAGDRRVVGVRSPGAGLDRALLPSATPSSALICAYGGLNPPHILGLYAHRVLSARRASSLARRALALPIGHTDDGLTSCPIDDGSFDAVAFHYPGRPDVDLGIHPRGCATTADGHIVVGGAPSLTAYVHRAPL
jgi:hypothetical protein